jgi:RimJ/RimL family protein N-acetyltransferase
MSSLVWPATAHDADAVLAACRDPETQRWMDVPVPYRREHAVAFVSEQSRQQWSSRRGTPFAIADADDDDRVLGSCGLVAVSARELVAEVVCAVAPTARGGRVAQRATRLLCDWALTDVGLARLEFYIEPANAPSRAVAERVGAQLEGILRSKTVIRGVRRDMALYALVR